VTLEWFQTHWILAHINPAIGKQPEIY
jgi:hypothetical protein